MKKLLILTIAAFVFQNMMIAQSPATKTTKETKVENSTKAKAEGGKVVKMDDGKNDKSTHKAGKPKKNKPAAEKTTASKADSVHLKADGTPDKRYKSSKHLKADGTPDKRYSENKK